MIMVYNKELQMLKKTFFFEKTYEYIFGPNYKIKKAN